MENTVTVDFSGVVPGAAAVSVGQPTKEMLSVRTASDGVTEVRINSSSLSLIQTCGRKSYYKLEQKWQPRQGSAPLIFGSAIHKAMEVFYAEPLTDRVVPHDFDEQAMLVANGHAANREHYLYEAVRAFVVEAEPLRMLPDTDKRSLSSGVWTLGHYFNVYANDRYAVARDEHGPMIERDFTLTLHEEPGLRIILFGRIDLILRNMVTGQRLPADHKTSSQMGADFFNRIKPNHQYTGYVLGAEQVLGEPVSEFLINGIQVKPRPLTARGGPPTFSRQITTRTPEDFTEFRDVVVEATKRYLGWAASGVWPLGPVDACASWGKCEFLDVCSAPNSLRSNILESKFTRTENT